MFSRGYALVAKQNENYMYEKRLNLKFSLKVNKSKQMSEDLKEVFERFTAIQEALITSILLSILIIYLCLPHI
jgi:hypothetical protein